MKTLIHGNANRSAVRLWGSWNEPELSTSPWHSDPKGARTAAYLWGETKRASEEAGCHRHCTVVAGEFSTYQDSHLYITHYEEDILQAEREHKFPTNSKPHVWGMHDYADLENVQVEKKGSKEILGHYANRNAQGFVKRTARLYRDTHIWMTEQGSELENKAGPLRLKKQSGLQKFAAEDFLRFGRVSEHVEWAYYYEYRGPTHAREFDSALLNGEGHEPEDWRPAYCVLAFGKAGCPAKVTTKAPVANTTTFFASTALLDVDPEEAATTYSVEYGTTEAYGKTTTSVAVVNENGEQSETIRLKGLEPCTTYHYQAEAENEANEGVPSFGGDQTLTTACLTPAVDVSAGGETTCAALTSGHVDCWGSNDLGLLGNGTRSEPELCPEVFFDAGCSSTPEEVSGIGNATAVSVGQEAACALLVNGHVDCWGDNGFGELGNGTTAASWTPAEVGGISTATAITVSETNGCALLSNGHVDCWASNSGGQLGYRPSEKEYFVVTPVEISGITSATAISAGSESICALLSSGGVDCWGENYAGQLGDGTTEGSFTPVAVSGITNATAIAVSPIEGNSFGEITAELNACALLSSGHVECWGGNSWGELGNGTTENSTTPVSVSGISNATAISTGQTKTCAVLTSGGVDCWGNGRYGQLGDGTTSNSNTPVTVAGVTEAVAVSAGNFDGCALRATGSLECWGFNEDGRLGNAAKETSSTPVPVSGI